MRLLPYLFFTCLFAIPLLTSAQKAKAVKAKKPIALKTFLGEFSGNISLPKNTVLSVVKSPLIIRDNKNKSYSLSSCQFIVRQYNQTEQEDGKIVRDSLQSGTLLKSATLPLPWQNRISEDMRPGDLLRFADVIAKDSTGQVYYSSDLIIRIK